MPSPIGGSRKLNPVVSSATSRSDQTFLLQGNEKGAALPFLLCQPTPSIPVRQSHTSRPFCTHCIKAESSFPHRVHFLTCQSLSSSCFKGKHVKGTLWPVIYLPFLPSFCRSHIASLLFLEHTRSSPTLRPWHWLFPLPGMYFPRCLYSQFPHILQVLLMSLFQ